MAKKSRPCSMPATTRAVSRKSRAMPPQISATPEMPERKAVAGVRLGFAGVAHAAQAQAAILDDLRARTSTQCEIGQ